MLRTWGEDIFKHAHGIHMGPDDTIYLTDDFDHTVRKCTLEGKVLLTIGVPGEPAPFMSGEPFRRCTHTALSPNERDLRVRRLRQRDASTSTRRTASACCRGASPGAGPGEFNLPHNIACDADGWVYVADRENHRIQVFDGNGRFETQWHDLHRPSGMYMPPGKCPVCYVGEIGPYYEFNRGAPNLGPRVTILSNEGKVLSRVAREPCGWTGPGPVHFAAWARRGFARRPVRGRSLLYRVVVGVSGAADARAHPQSAEVRKGRRRLNCDPRVPALPSSPRRRGPSGFRQTTLGSRFRGNDDIQDRRVTHFRNTQ